MIGLHFSKLLESQWGCGVYYSDSDKYIQKEQWHHVEELLKIEKNGFCDRLVLSKYDGYPISKWEDEDTLCILEGIIFNIPEDLVKKRLLAIARSFSIDIVGDFVKEADGDFIACVYRKATGKVLFFNDELGGLPFYYYADSSTFIAGRSCTYIASLSKDIEVSKLNMAELLCFNYNMAERTIFEHITAMTPAMYVLCDINDGKVKVSKGQTVERSYTLSNPFKTKEEAISALKDLFIEGTRTRCEYARKHGYAIVNTMSGGFDSRTILGGIEACIPSDEYQNVTYEYDTDESEVALAVLKAVGSKSEYLKLSYENKPDFYNSDISVKTEGKISTYTNSICYNDLIYGYENYFKGKKLLYFGGFGGEYIRHPLFASIWNASNIGGKTSPTLKEVSKLCGIPFKLVQSMINSTFRDCKSSESFCKKFYDEYYRRYVRGAGEERIRMFYFSVQPMMSKPFILAIRNRVPLKWVGYEFYTLFLNAINPALTTVGRHGGHPNIHSVRSLRQADFKNRSYLLNSLRWFVVRHHLRIKKGGMSYDVLLRKLHENSISKLIDLGELAKHFNQYSQHTQCKIAAALFYVNELSENVKRH